ncbi:MAG: TerB family tellurite resistance protein [Nitrospirales bacterium]
MADKRFILELGKLFIAAAWADGELSTAELNGLKELLFQLPDISGEEWMELELYMASPVTEAERERLFTRVLQGMTSTADREMVLETLKGLIPADAPEDHPQSFVVRQLAEDIQQGSQGFFEHLRRPLRWVLGVRGQRYTEDVDRESRLEDFIKNTIYFQVTMELRAKGMTIDLDDTVIRKLCLAAGLMARVAGVDHEISPEEMQVMQEVLKTTWTLSDSEAKLVSEISHHRVFRGLDGVRLVKEFNRHTTRTERKEFLACLFQVANAANATSYDEIEEIRSMAKGMELTHQDFIDAKLLIPREDREGL